MPSWAPGTRNDLPSPEPIRNQTSAGRPDQVAAVAVKAHEFPVPERKPAAKSHEAPAGMVDETSSNVGLRH